MKPNTKSKTWTWLAIGILLVLVGFYQNCSPNKFEFEAAPPSGAIRDTEPPICVPLHHPDLEPVEKFRWNHAQGSLPEYRQVMSSPMVADLDRDSIPEIVFTSFHEGGAYNNPGVLRVISGATGAEKFSISDNALAPQGDSSPLLIDIDGDGYGEILYIHHQDTKLIALNHDGTTRWEATLPRSLGDCIGGPAAGDFDADGRAEILIENLLVKEISTSNVTVTAVGPYQKSSCTTFAMSVDPNQPDVLHVVTAAGVFKADGTPVLQLPLGDSSHIIGAYRGRRLAAADIAPELPGIELVFSEEGRLKAYNILSGNALFDVAIATDPNRFGGLAGDGGPPNISDFDGDNSPDIGVAGAVFYAVYDRNGQIKWQQATNDYSSQITGSSVFDFNGDGTSEVIYGDEGYTKIYQGPTGEFLFNIANPSATHLEYPIVVDVDNDGASELLITMNSHRVPEWATPEEGPMIQGVGSGLRVFKSRGGAWVPTRKLWNQYSYFVTNVTDNLRAASSTPVIAGQAQKIFRQNTLNQFDTGCRN